VLSGFPRILLADALVEIYDFAQIRPRIDPIDATAFRALEVRRDIVPIPFGRSSSFLADQWCQVFDARALPIKTGAVGIRKEAADRGGLTRQSRGASVPVQRPTRLYVAWFHRP
jgi:hypothetical protein